MKQIIGLWAALLLLPTPALAQTHRHPQGGIHLSLWPGLSTGRVDTLRTTSFNLGLVSRLHRLEGVGINLLGGITAADVRGLQAAGLFQLTGGRLTGVQLSGITGVVSQSASGIALAGLVQIAGGHARGVTIAGLTNIVGEDGDGVMTGGLINFIGKNGSGLHLAGVASLVGDRFTGLSVTGLLNIAGDRMQGVQLSGLINITGQLRGLQLAPFNLAETGTGIQIGLVNYSRKAFKGVRLGLINATPQTRLQLMLLGGTRTKLNAALRFKNRRSYTVVGAGYPYGGFDEGFSGSLFYRAGLYLPLSGRLTLSGDVGYQHLETFRATASRPRRFFALQGRVNLEYPLGKQIALLLSGGYGASRAYNRRGFFDPGLLAEAGVVLF
ncbi:MAG: hypothetical protein LBM06_01815 [Prevotellaceae bacterium]|jgi:hypothetical protein|nr:hypothetical protein [Prevotellaceae bacterium]